MQSLTIYRHGVAKFLHEKLTIIMSNKVLLIFLSLGSLFFFSAICFHIIYFKLTG